MPSGDFVHHQTREVDGPSAEQLVQSMRMQMATEKVIVNVGQLLALIKDIRSQVLMHDYTEIKRETKANNEEVKRGNQIVMTRIWEKMREIERIEGIIENDEKVI